MTWTLVKIVQHRSIFWYELFQVLIADTREKTSFKECQIMVFTYMAVE